MGIHNVVLITYGEPPTPAFGGQLGYSWRILLGLTRTIAPIPKPIIPLIALYRGYTRTKSWNEEGYASPLEPITRDQADALKAMLTERHPQTEWRVHVSYEFRHPLLVDVLKRMAVGEAVTVIPMYATDSAFTHGISRETVRQWQADHGEASRSVTVQPHLDATVLGKVSADHIKRELASRGFAAGSDCALVLAAHGTLLEPPKPIDTGLEATERLCADIKRRLEPDFGLVVNGWLNHTRGGRWTEPPIDEALQTVIDKGFERVVYFPYGFLADNAESQLEGQQALNDAGLQDAAHLPCLNDSPSLIQALAEQVMQSAAAQSSSGELASVQS